MNPTTGTLRRPYRGGDFHLVDTRREGTYWQSSNGICIRIASGEASAMPGRRVAPAWSSTLAILFGRTARQ